MMESGVLKKKCKKIIPHVKGKKTEVEEHARSVNSSVPE